MQTLTRARRSARSVLIAGAGLALLVAGPVRAAQIYVSPTGSGVGTMADPAGLQAALTTAQANGEDDTLNLMQGTYTGIFTYVGAAGEDFSLHLDGGWTPDFLVQASDPANTILDGNLAGRVLTLDNQANDAAGSFFLEGLTIRDGLVAGANGGGLLVEGFPPGEIRMLNLVFDNNETNQHGGGFFAYSHDGVSQTGGEIIVLNCVVRNNRSGNDDPGPPIYFGGGGYLYSGAHTLLQNNLVHDNVARGTAVNDGSGGGLYVTVLQGELALLHNTIVANSAYHFGGGIVLHSGSWSDAQVSLHNNIIRGNSATVSVASGDVHNDLSQDFAANSLVVRHNDYHAFLSFTGASSGSLLPAASGNIDLDPAYAGAGDYELTAGSPALDTGDPAAPDGIPIDLLGFVRNWDGDGDGTAVPDMGAYEFGTSSEAFLLSPTAREAVPSGTMYPVFLSSPAEPGEAWGNLLFSRDNGRTWKRVATKVFKRYFLWDVPTPPRNLNRCRLKSIGYNTATGARLGAATSGTFTVEVVKLTSPDGGEALISGSDVSVTWQMNGTVREAVKAALSYTLDGGKHWRSIGQASAPLASQGVMPWTVPKALSPKTRCRVKVVLKDAAGRVVGSDTSDRLFTIGAVLLTSPNGGETFATGEPWNMTWRSSAGTDSFDLHYSVNGGRTWKLLEAGVPAGGGPYAGLVPAQPRNQTRCLVRVRGYDSGAGTLVGADTSDRTFRIEVLTLTEPNAGSQVKGAPVTLGWNAYDTVDPVDAIQLSYTVDRGATWKPIVELAGTESSYPWSIPNVVRRKASFKVKVVLRNAAGRMIGADVSDRWMKILAP